MAEVLAPVICTDCGHTHGRPVGEGRYECVECKKLIRLGDVLQPQAMSLGVDSLGGYAVAIELH